ncbi:uncharacterized protein LOC135147904 [Daucus carota subsp. sativus]|uniref:uncharacterized protein LOC135147904 n=1 Tax=Daucus carota subsp. sativus TaxID=79200 RepID=UPI003083A1E4
MKEFESQLSINQEIEVDERYAIELEEELKVELLQNKNRIAPENPPKKKTAKSRSKMPEAAKRREEEPEKHVQSSKPSSPIKETTVMHPDVNFHDEPILPKEEPIDLDNILVPAFLIQETSKPKKKRKSVEKKMANLPKPPKEPENADDYLVIANIEEISELELDLNDLQEVRGIELTSKLLERLIFSYKSQGDITWPLHRVLSSEGFSSLTKIYDAMKRTGGFTPPAKQMVLKRILEIRKEWNSDASLQRRLKIPYIGKKIHHEPTPIMEFRDSQGVMRFFRPKDQLKIASLNTRKTLQSKLNRQDSDEEWYAIELEEELEAELLQNKNRIAPENPPKKKRVKSRSKMPEAAKRREEEPEKHVQSSKPSSPIKETTVMHPDVNFHDEPILPKEEPIDLDNIPVPAFLIQETSKPKKKGKSVEKKMANLPKPPKEPENADDYLVIAYIEEISELELDLNVLQEVRGIEPTSKLPERLIF